MMLLIAVLYTLWLRCTWQAKQRLSSWGPRWIAHVIMSPLPKLAAALGISAEAARLDGVDAPALAAIGPCVVTISPHGLGVGHTMLTGPALLTPPLDALQPIHLTQQRRVHMCLWKFSLEVIAAVLER